MKSTCTICFALSPYQCKSITYQMLPWISPTGEPAGAEELVSLGRGKLPPRRAWGPPGAAAWGRRRVLAAGSSGLWVQQLPLAPAELRAVLHFPSLQPFSGQADFLLLWSCWSQALSYSHPCSLSLLCGDGTKLIFWFFTILENRELDLMTKLVVSRDIGISLNYGPLLPSLLAFNQGWHCWRLVTRLRMISKRHSLWMETGSGIYYFYKSIHISPFSVVLQLDVLDMQKKKKVHRLGRCLC